MGNIIGGIIGRIITLFIMKYRGCAVAFWGALCLFCFTGIVAPFAAIQQGSAIGVLICLALSGLFGWLMYRTIISPTWAPTEENMIPIGI
jgi:hypothetical protein